MRTVGVGVKVVKGAIHTVRFLSAFSASVSEASPVLAQTGFPHVTISTCNDFAIRKTKTSLLAPLGFLVRGAIMFGGNYTGLLFSTAMLCTCGTLIDSTI